MWTTAVAYLIVLMGFITFAGGAFGPLILIFEDAARTGRVPLRYYAMMVALISGGLGHDRHWAGLAAAAADLGKE